MSHFFIFFCEYQARSIIARNFQSYNKNDAIMQELKYKI